jgi:L-alanine-DL-glutamate epimerase-like enolase superfamily enzyme
VPLPRPFTLGTTTIDRREFAVLRLESVGGLVGAACSLTRGEPIEAEIGERLADALLGADAREDLIPDGSAGRAFSLVDVALWDIRAQAARQPLWRMLGEYRIQAPVLLVEGYPHDGEEAGTFADRLAARADEGYRALKLAGVPDPAELGRRLARARELVPPDTALMVDVNRAWSDLPTAVAAARAWAPHEPAWVEDPFPPEQAAAIAELRRTDLVPVAAGDEVSHPDTLRALVDAVDVLRLDAMTLGGVSGFLEARAQAVRAGVPISTHIAPEVHRHFAFAFPEVSHVELFPPGSPFFGVDELVERDSLDVRDGMIHAPDEPGVGAVIDWDGVRHWARRHTTRSL